MAQVQPVLVSERLQPAILEFFVVKSCNHVAIANLVAVFLPETQPVGASPAHERLSRMSRLTVGKSAAE